VIGRAIAADRADRYAEMAEFGADLEAGPAAVAIVDRRPPTFYQRNRLVVWQAISGLLALALAASLWLRR